MEEGDLYYNSGKNIWLRINGVHFKRVTGKGWEIVSKEEVESGEVKRWAALHENQREVYLPQLKKEGLIGE
ncbi:hypothetical protein GCM10028807_32750 [Spirosoma daeguense]